MEKKKCFKCNEVKPLSEFYKHPQMADGHLNKCKECTKKDARKTRSDNIEYYREYDRLRANLPHRIEKRKEVFEKYKSEGRFTEIRRVANKKYRHKYPEKASARRILNYNIRNGVVEKQPCEVCGSKKSEAHHDDYSKPLEVRWLCDKHHKEVHVKNGSFRASI